MAFRKQLVGLAVFAGMVAGVPSRATADLIYSTSFSATATIQCGAFKGGTCTPNGNSISIQSDAGPTLTITFLGVSNVPIVATLGSQIVDLGIIQTTLSGPGTFAVLDPNFQTTSPFQFGVTIRIQTSVTVNDIFMSWHRVSPTTVVWNYPFNCCQLPFDNNAAAPYDLVFGSVQAAPLTAGGSTRITAVYGLYTAPEHATLTLMATGLFMVMGVAISRRRHPHGSSADGP
jgi:hypothetical protein